MLSNLLLQCILDEAAEDEKKKKDKEEEKAQEPETEEEENNEQGKDGDNPDDPGEPEENPEESDGEAPEGEEPAPEDGEAPGEEGEGDNAGENETDNGDNDGAGADDADGEGMGDFSLDSDNPEEEDLGPAPDGLPEADDDGSNDMEEEDPDGETNIQTNIMKLSKLDRALAKKQIGGNLSSLRFTIKSMLSTIDRYEAAIDPEVRETVVDKLNNIHGELESFILHRFPILNYEDNLTQYLILVKKANEAIEYVRSKGIKGGKK